MIKSQRLWFNEINKYCTSVCLHARSVFSISERVNDAQYKLISASVWVAHNMRPSSSQMSNISDSSAFNTTIEAHLCQNKRLMV